MSHEDITFRWIDGPTASQEDWDQLEMALAARGWMSLNRATSRVLVAESADGMISFHVFQLVPFCGPLWVKHKYRGSGIAETMADKMQDFLVAHNARGWIATAESPYAAKLCESHGMERLPSPVYVMVNPGGVEV